MRSRQTSISSLLGMLVLSALALSEARLHDNAASRTRREAHDQAMAALAAGVDRGATVVAEAPSPDAWSPCLAPALTALAEAPPRVAGRHACIAAATVAHPLYLRSVVLLL
jgi:hypothetical protein